MTTTPILSGRDIGQTENALRALLETLLAETGLTYPRWTILFALDRAGSLPLDTVVAQQADGLKVPPEESRATAEGLLAAGLVAGGEAGLTLTPVGEAVFRPVRRAVAALADELYGGLPPADLEATRRTLDEVTRRANARLAATG
jgi:DNA-binding MarR family transcriptional regulator